MPISLFQPHLKALFLPLVLVDDHAHLQSEIYRCGSKLF